MKLVSTQRCLIGEGPIWNRFNNKLYYVNAKGKNEIHMVDIESGDCFVRQLPFGVAAMGFSVDGRMLVSCEDGAFYLNGDNTREPLYNPLEYKILYGNDAKVGPDGRFYIGTQSRKRKGVGNEIDGKLYSIDKNGIVKVLLDGLILSNGFEWSIDKKRFYHTDSDTNMIKEYEFDKQNGELYFTGRQIMIPGVDGFTIGQNDMLYVACWGQGHIAVVDTSELKIRDYIRVPTQIPASCGFAGKDMEQLIIVTATSGVDLETDTNAGFTYSCELGVRGRPPFLFG